MSGGGRGDETRSLETMAVSLERAVYPRGPGACILVSALLKSLFLGQLMAVLMSTRFLLVSILIEFYGVRVRAGLSLFAYLFLLLSCLSWARVMRGVPLGGMIRSRGVKYLCYSILDTQANYTRLSALSHTTLVSVQLLLCFSIPVVLVLSWLLLKARYQLSHIFGLALGVMSVVVMVWLDVRDGHGGVTTGGTERLLGDMLALLSAALAALSQVAAALTVRDFHPSEYLGMLGLCGTTVTGIQMLAVERAPLAALAAAPWEAVALLACLALAQVIYYLCLPTVLQLCTPAGLNLSLLATIFYSLAAATLIFTYQFNLLHLVAAGLVLLGNLTFYWKPVLSSEDLNPSGGSSSGSGDTETCSEGGEEEELRAVLAGRCEVSGPALQRHQAGAGEAALPSPPYYTRAGH